MTRLEENERVLIDLARDADDPSDADRARVRSALAARLGVVAGLGTVASVGAQAGLGGTATASVGAAAGAGSGVGAGAIGGAVTGGAMAVKLISVVVVASTAVGVGTVVVHGAHRAPPAAVSAPAPNRAAPPAPPNVAGPATVVKAPPAEDPPVEAAPPPPARATAGQPLERRSARAAAPSSVASLPTLADEARLLHDGVAALRAGHAARALALFDAHAALYPMGALVEERAAERALALAELGRVDEARAAAEDFLRAHPGSPLAARLRERLRALDGAGAGK